MNKITTVKELPDSEKPYEKFLTYGPEYLSDAELLAVIIRSGTSGLKSVEVAQNLLNDGHRNLLNLYDIPFEKMQKIRGIGPIKAIQLKCIAELSKRIARTAYQRNVSLDNAASVASYYMEQLRHEKQELLIACMFDSKCRLMEDCVLSLGTVNASLISPREIFLAALEHKAVYLILVHNHPSGVPLPSREDTRITEQLCQVGEILRIPLSDHIIIGDGSYYSYREHGQITERKV